MAQQPSREFASTDPTTGTQDAKPEKTSLKPAVHIGAPHNRPHSAVEPGTAGSNRRERDDRGLRREDLPARTKRAATLGVDRHGSGQCGDGKGAKEDERGDIAVGDQMQRRPS
jgi:hypothetical protein